MANQITYKDKIFTVGDTIAVNYTFREGDKQRQQLFEGILLKVKGHDNNNRMITVRKMSHSGIGIERIIPLTSPFIKDIKLIRKSKYTKAKVPFLKGLSGQQVRHKLYKGENKR